MGMFNISSGSSEENKSLSKVGWKQLLNVLQLEELVAESEDKPVLIFKHSTRCGVSRMVLKKFENEYDLEDAVAPYFLDLLAHRNLSNEIARLFGVGHESPQVLLIRNGKVVYDASHSDIDVADLTQYI
ncbi:MAG: bacillithiol system redox-active protein YtxJ [Bacteroidota bacterium]